MQLAFFRRHRKYFMLLMFAAVISMVFFATWQSFWSKMGQWFGSEGAREKVGTIDGRLIRARELSEFFQAVRVSGQASQSLAMALDRGSASPEARQRLYAYTVGMSAWPILSGSLKDEKPDRKTAMTWLALYDEARQRGFSTSKVEVAARLEGLQNLGMTSELLRQVVDAYAGGQSALLEESFRTDMTLRAYIGYLSEAAAGAVEPEMRREFARMDERLKVRMAVLKAEEALGEVKEVADDVLRDQFTKYKAYLVGKSDEGYGYRIPDRVAVEYLVVEPAGFRDKAAPKVTDERVRAYYDLSKDPEFLIEEKAPEKPEAEEKKDAEKGEKGDEAAGKKQEAPKEPEKRFRPFEEVRDEIRKKLIDDEAEVLARERLIEDVAEIRTMKKPPDLGIWADGKQVRHVAVPDRHTAEKLAKLEGIGGATRDRDDFASYAVSVVDLVGATKGRIGKMEISDVFRGLDGKAYAFRVTDVEHNHEPPSLDEVRDKVLADVRMAKAFEIVRERGKSLLEEAAAKGIEAAAKDAGVETVESEWFPRERAIPYGGRWLTFPPSLPKVGASAVVVSECFKMASDGRQRTLVTLADDRTVVLAELVGKKAPREAAYKQMRSLIAARVGQAVAGKALRQALDLDAIQQRMAVVVEEVERAAAHDEAAETETEE